jgi:hypothetical protein
MLALQLTLQIWTSHTARPHLVDTTAGDDSRKILDGKCLKPGGSLKVKKIVHMHCYRHDTRMPCQSSKPTIPTDPAQANQDSTAHKLDLERFYWTKTANLMPIELISDMFGAEKRMTIS